jgi:hypothetical protein
LAHRRVEMECEGRANAVVTPFRSAPMASNAAFCSSVSALRRLSRASRHIGDCRLQCVIDVAAAIRSFS